MKREDLIAPLQYNLVSEIERFTKDEGKIAVKWENHDGETKEITYEALMKNANKIGNVFLKKGLKKGDVILIIIPRLVEAYEVYLAALKVRSCCHSKFRNASNKRSSISDYSWRC